LSAGSPWIRRREQRVGEVNDCHRWMPLRSGAVQDRCGAIVCAALLVPRLPVYRRRRGTVNVFFPSEALNIEGLLVDYQCHADSGRLMLRQFCPSCGTPVFTQADTRKHYVGVRAGTLDDPDLGKPQITIWTSSAPSWAYFDPALPREERQAPPGR
jgi:hypothetical protein